MRDTAQDEINFELKIGYRASSESIKAGGQRGKTGGIVALGNVIIKDKRRRGEARRE